MMPGEPTPSLMGAPPPSVMGAPMGTGGPMGMGGPAMPMIVAAPTPSVIPENTPIGLEYLIPTNQITIQQQVEWGEVLLGLHFNNRYHILDAWGRRMYFAAENSGCCARVFCGPCRSWNISAFDSTGRPVMQGNRESGCCGCCCNNIQVVAASGQPLGGVKQNCKAVTASWDIMDGNGQVVLRLESPTCTVLCPRSATCCEAHFPLVTVGGGRQQVGKITKFWGGLGREMITQADTFGVEFPVDLDVTLKATLVFAAFMIDFMYYEAARHE